MFTLNYLQKKLSSFGEIWCVWAARARPGWLMLQNVLCPAPFCERLLYMSYISYLGLTFLFCWVNICAKKHPTNMAWRLLYVATFRAHLWVSWCFSLLVKAVKITGLAARACMAQVWPLARCALPTHLAAAVTDYPKCILCLFEFMPSLRGGE